MKAVIFDMDDTLYPERDYVLSGFRAVAKWFEENYGVSYEISKHTLISLFNNGIRGNTFNVWLEQIDIDYTHELILECLQIYRSHTPKLKPYDDVVPTLEWLKPDYQIGLISDGYLDVQRRKFNALGISSFFNVVVFSDEWGRESWKPSKVPFEYCLRKLNVVPDEALYIGDNPLKDFLGANQLGMQSVWIKRPNREYLHRKPPSELHNPHYVVETFEEFLTILK